MILKTTIVVCEINKLLCNECIFLMFVRVCARILFLTQSFVCPSEPGSCAWLSPFFLCANHTCVLVCVCLLKCVIKVVNINKHKQNCDDVCCFVVLNQYWEIVTFQGFPDERAKGTRTYDWESPTYLLALSSPRKPGVAGFSPSTLTTSLAIPIPSYCS